MDERRRFYVVWRTKKLGEPRRKWHDSFYGSGPNEPEQHVGRDSVDRLFADVDHGAALLLTERDADRWAAERALVELRNSAPDAALRCVKGGWQILDPGVAVYRWLVHERLQSVDQGKQDTATTVRVTITVPKSLRARMALVEDKVNWSAVASRAFESVVAERAEEPDEPVDHDAALITLVDRIMALPLREAASLFEGENAQPLKTAHLAAEDRIVHAARIAVYLSMRLRHQANHATAVDASNRLTGLIGQALGRYETKSVSF